MTTLMRGEMYPETRNKDQLKPSGLGSAGALPQEQHSAGSPCTLQGGIMSWRTAGSPCSRWALRAEGSSPGALAPPGQQLWHPSAMLAGIHHDWPVPGSHQPSRCSLPAPLSSSSVTRSHATVPMHLLPLPADTSVGTQRDGYCH